MGPYMRHHMYTEPKIILPKSLNERAYIIFYYNGKRVRVYNGKPFNLKIHPNRAQSLRERQRLLNILLFELKDALRKNIFTDKLLPQEIFLNTAEALKKSLNSKLESDLSNTYKRDLKTVHEQFISFLNDNEKQADLETLKLNRIEEFLAHFQSSGTYYMNKRRNLGVLLSNAGRIIDKPINVVTKTSTRKANSKLHKIYEPEQLKTVLAYLKENHQHVYLCCLITYGCFLRPHKEVRKLTSGHFKKNITEIHLSGSENKGKKVRVVYVPDYVRNELVLLLPSLKATDNIFSKNVNAYNEAYFNTAWTRCWKKMFKLGIVQKNHTVYSFRHTAAVNVYNRSKDVNLLKSLLGHSSILVTLKYLRGLGEYNEEMLKDAAPRLEF
jgi:integrase